VSCGVKRPRTGWIWNLLYAYDDIHDFYSYR
jgi:hypothetical protein